MPCYKSILSAKLIWWAMIIKIRMYFYNTYEILTLIHMNRIALHYVFTCSCLNIQPKPVRFILPSSFSLTHKEQTLCRYMSDRFSRRVLPTSYYRTFLVERDEAILHFDRLTCLTGPLSHYIFFWLYHLQFLFHIRNVYRFC